jgi:hypothetical protein
MLRFKMRVQVRTGLVDNGEQPRMVFRPAKNIPRREG